jgi:hypothetical protein
MGNFFNSEFAPGIPDRNNRATLPSFTKPQKWEFVLHDHKADKAGQHFDLRLGDPKTGQAHSWVIRSWPKNGEKVLAIMQPTHTVKYMDFNGVIESGYGKGTVDTADRDRIEVIKSSPNKITFYKYVGSGIEKFSLIKTGDENQWLLLNHTSSGAIGKYFNEIPKYKMKDISTSYAPQSDDFITPKIDGAYATMILRPDKIPIVLSSRVSKRTGLPIEYTPKLFNVVNKVSPKSLGTTILRTEIYSTTPDGQELPNRTLGGILNANVWKSRDMQKELSAPLRLAVTDVVKYKGQDVSWLNAADKYKLIDEIKQQYSTLDSPLDLQKKIHFKEGKVIWRNGIPMKVKERPDYDVYVKEIFPAVLKSGTPRAGGFKYSLHPSGPIVGNVGTGFKHSELIDMQNNPNDYIGRVAKVTAMEQHPSGALRAPSFIDWHLDK